MYFENPFGLHKKNMIYKFPAGGFNVIRPKLLYIIDCSAIYLLLAWNIRPFTKMHHPGAKRIFLNLLMIQNNDLNRRYLCSPAPLYRERSSERQAVRKRGKPGYRHPSNKSSVPVIKLFRSPMLIYPALLFLRRNTWLPHSFWCKYEMGKPGKIETRDERVKENCWIGGKKNWN